MTRSARVTVCITLLFGACRGDRESWRGTELRVPTVAVADVPAVRAVAWTRGTEAPNAAIIFLHGVGGSSETWVQLSGNAALAAALDSVASPTVHPVVVAVGGDSLGWPVRRDGAVNWRAFLGRELPEFLRARFGAPLTSDRIAYLGTSAGGATALTLALGEPAGFRCVAAHSPAIHPEDPSQMPAWARSWEGWNAEYGTPIDASLWRVANPISLARSQDSSALASLQLYFDVGSEDHLGFAPTSAQLSQVLTERGISHEFHLRTGGHGSAFTGPNLAHSLPFLLSCLAHQIER